MSDKLLYKIISDELASSNPDSAIWTQATAISEGDPEKTKAAYIRLRYRDLLHTSSQSPSQASSSNENTVHSSLSQSELDRMREELKRKLATTNRSTLYLTLGLEADASDSTISTTIAARETENLTASALSISEFNYAKRVLGDPVLREQYDRKLLGIFNNESNQNRIRQGLEVAESTSWVLGNRGSVVIGVLSFVLVGYLGLDYFKANNSHAIQKQVVDSMNETDKAETYANIELKSSAADVALERQRQEYELRTRALDQQRYEQQFRLQNEQERLRLQREQSEARQLQQQQHAEDMKVQKEKRYWACVNQQLSMPNVTTYTAYGRCGAYR